MAYHYDRKAELIAEIDRARSRTAAYRQAMEGSGERATHKAEAKLAKNRYAWIIGAVVLGFLVAKLPARTKKVYVDRKGKSVAPEKLETAGKAGLAMALLKIVIDVTKPVIMAWATKRLGEMVAVSKEVRHKVEKVDRKL